MAKQGRIAGGLISILSGIYLMILNFLNLTSNIQTAFFIYTFIIAILGIFGGYLSLEDWILGGGLSITGGVILIIPSLMSLIFSRELGAIPYLIGAGLIGLGGFIALLIGSEFRFRINKSEFDLVDDWIKMNEMEIVNHYNVEKIEAFDELWGGLVFLVEFSKNMNPDSIKKLIVFLEENWRRKVFIITKAGLKESELSSGKYIIYQKEGGHLTYKMGEEIKLDE